MSYRLGIFGFVVVRTALSRLYLRIKSGAIPILFIQLYNFRQLPFGVESKFRSFLLRVSYRLLTFFVSLCDYPDTPNDAQKQDWFYGFEYVRGSNPFQY